MEYDGDEMDDDDEEEQAPPRDPLVKWGLIAALVGIAVGIVVAVMRLEDFSKVFEVPRFSVAMVPSFVLGAVAAVLAVYALIEERGTRSAAAEVMFLGVAAIATPFLAIFVLGLLLGAMVVMTIIYMLDA